MVQVFESELAIATPALLARVAEWGAFTQERYTPNPKPGTTSPQAPTPNPQPQTLHQEAKAQALEEATAKVAEDAEEEEEGDIRQASGETMDARRVHPLNPSSPKPQPSTLNPKP